MDSTQPASVRPPHVCVIDADAAVRDGLTTLIKLHGQRVVAFPTASGFLASFADATTAASDSGPRCVICEAELPDLDGFTVHRRLRHVLPKARFALLVSGNSPVLYRRAKRAGIQHVYRKPLSDPYALLAFVETPSHALGNCG